MKIALSPCPNDTYLFHAWIENLIGHDLPCIASFADIEQLNAWALDSKQEFALIKLSFPCFARVAHNYQLLPVGTALGFNCGPKIIAKHYFDPSELEKKRILIPGEMTTAHLLLNHLLPTPKEKQFCPYHMIMDLLDKDESECGLIIHESRFVFKERGFVEIADLGELWQTHYQLPIPLGGLAIKRTTPPATKKRVVEILLQSLLMARQKTPLSFICKHAQEKKRQVVQAHIDTYVTDETQNLSTLGKKAVTFLLKEALPHDWLYE